MITQVLIPGKDRSTDQADGVIFCTISIQQLKSLIQFDHDYISYFQILSKQGRSIVHPNEEYVLAGKLIFEEAWEEGDDALNSLAVNAVSGGEGYVSHIDPETKVESWMIYEPVENSGWSMVAVVDKDRLTDEDDMRKSWFLTIALFIASVSFLSIYGAIRWMKFSPQYLLSISILLSIIVSLGVISLWMVADYYPIQSSDDQLKIVSDDVLNDFENKQTQMTVNNNIPKPIFIKTGVYLQSIEFEGANNVKISGYIWQHYKKGEHKGISRGFVLPEAGTPTIEESYRDLIDPDDLGCHTKVDEQRDCEELVGWYVSGTLRQEFDYSLYPLDSQQVWIKMWHESYRENIILVPDIEAYALLNPKSSPGVQHDFVLPGWKIQQSWFSINNQIFSTSFGNKKVHGIQYKPELLYNVNIKREFLNPFVSRIIPVIVILVLMYLIVLISTKTDKAASWLGFSANDVVLGLSALFFVIGLSHADLRQFLSSPSIMYFEYLYFVIYIMLLYVAISSIYIAKKQVNKNRDENFFSKNLYWPFFSNVLFVVTFGVFY